jgi:ribonuclease HI
MSRRPFELLTPQQVLERYSGGPKTGVFTDGSCEGNPGPGGWGVVRVEDDRVIDECSGFEPDTTNNRMELAALIAGYRMLAPDARTTVYSDSQLCVRTINEWASGWERRGWRRKSGPIANLKLVQELYALSGEHPDVELRWIKAHDGARWNEYADALASGYLRR